MPFPHILEALVPPGPYHSQELLGLFCHHPVPTPVQALLSPEHDKVIVPFSYRLLFPKRYWEPPGFCGQMPWGT